MSSLISMRELSRRLGVTLRAVQLAEIAGRIAPERVEKAGKQTRKFFDYEKSKRDWLAKTDFSKRHRPTRREKLKGDQPFHVKKTDKLNDPEQNQDNNPYVPGAPSGDSTLGATDLYTKSRSAREAYKAKITKLEFEEKSGKLVDVEKLKSIWYETATNVQRQMLSVADRLSPILAPEKDHKKIHQILKVEITSALNALSNGGTYG